MIRPLVALFDRLGLRRLRRLRRILKRTACRIIDPLGRGRIIRIEAGAALRVPAYYANVTLVAYEKKSMEAVLGFLHRHPAATLADVGCSVAIYSLLALQSSAQAQVLAFDSDRIALKTSEEFCRFGDRRRLRFIHGYLTESHDSGQSLAGAVAATDKLLADPALRPEPTDIRYFCLGQPPPPEEIPRHSLDGLLCGVFPSGSPSLVKIDVEGAELVVLSGAREFLRQARPTLLLSVHPQFLPGFHQSVGEVEAFLRAHGYRWTVLDVDHEEHWWCEPA